jgi:hypothetical protein
MAARWRLSLSLSTPTLAAELVCNYATGGERTLAMGYGARALASLSSAGQGPTKLPR